MTPEPWSEDECRAGPGAGSRAAARVVQDVLADLDRRWAVPPVEFAAELAREVVRALRREPDLLRPLADAVGEAVARNLLEARGRALLDDLAGEGVTVRVEGGRLLAGPRAKVTNGVADKLRRGRDALAAALGV